MTKMFVLKLILKVIAFPVMLIVTILQWFGAFMVGFSAAVFNILAGLFLLVAGSSYILGLASGPEALKMIAVGFAIFMIPVIGEGIVTAIITANASLRDFIRS
jgi:hypothetical protein